MSEEMQKLTIRVTQLEIGMYRLISILKDQSDAVNAAATMPLNCDACGCDITQMDTCNNQPCQWGFPGGNDDRRKA